MMSSVRAWCIFLTLCTFILDGLTPVVSEPLEPLPELMVITESLPPYQITLHGELVGGEAAERVKKWINASRLKNKIYVLNWARAYQMTLSRPNVLLFSIVRTPEREDKFIWLGKIAELHFHLISNANRELTLSGFDAARQFIIGVKRSDVMDDHFRQLGFKYGKNLVAVNSEVNTFKLLLANRVDLIPGAPNLVLGECERIGCRLDQFKVHMEIPGTQSDMYLVASLGTHPIIVKLLLSLADSNTLK